MTAPPAPPPHDASPRVWPRLAVGVAVVAALVAALVWLPVAAWIERLLAWVDTLGAWGPIVVAAAYVPAAVLAIPGSILTLGAGFLFGVVTGSIVVSIGSTAGAVAAFALARRLGSDSIARRIERQPRFRAVANAIEDNGLKIVLLTRLSPVFPFTFLNYAYGLTSVRFRDYLLGSWLGMLPGTVMYVYLGSALTKLSQIGSGAAAAGGQGDTARQILFWGGLAATVVVTVLVTRIARRALKSAASIDDNDNDEAST